MSAQLFLKNTDQFDTYTSDTVKMMLVKDYVFDGNHQFVSDVNSTEITDASYARQTLAGKTRVVDVENKKITIDSDDISFGILTSETYNGAILIKEITNDLDSLVLSYWSFDDVVANGVDEHEIQIPALGLLVMTDAST